MFAILHTIDPRDTFVRPAMKIALAILLLLVLVLIPGLIGRVPETEKPPVTTGMPWHITLESDGSSRVFGLMPGRSTLQDAVRIFGSPEVAIIGQRERPGALEAFFDGINLGALTGKLTITSEMTDDVVEAMRQRSPKTEYMESTLRRSRLAPADLELALRTPLRALAFVPSARLDEAIILQRFGTPAERIMTADAQHFLYPHTGTDVAINAAGKAVVQYVAPAQFHQLRDPLIKSQSK